MFLLLFPVTPSAKQEGFFPLPLEWAAHFRWYFFSLLHCPYAHGFFLNCKLFFHVSSSGNCFHSGKNNTDSKTLHNTAPVSVCTVQSKISSRHLLHPWYSFPFSQATVASPSLLSSLRPIASPLITYCCRMRGTRWFLRPRDGQCLEATRKKPNPCHLCLILRNWCLTRQRTARWSFLPVTGGAFCLKAAPSLC